MDNEAGLLVDHGEYWDMHHAWSCAMHDVGHVWFILVYLGHDRSWVMVGYGLLQ